MSRVIPFLLLLLFCGMFGFIVFNVLQYRKVDTGNYEIKHINAGNVTRYDYLIEEAIELWETIIVEPVGNFTNDDNTDLFNGRLGVAYTGNVDDIVIGYDFQHIDGIGGTLGLAGNTYTRYRGDQLSFPIASIMIFDIEDFELYSDFMLKKIIIHELGHALGFSNFLFEKCTTECMYSCERATLEYQLEFDTNDELRMENDGGEGTVCFHWESDMVNKDGISDIMVGWVTFDFQPISKITIAAFEDMGYQVNYNAAQKFESFSLSQILNDSQSNGFHINMTRF